MAKVKVFEAATEGFRLIRREPKAALAWSLVSFVLMGAPMALFMSRLSRTVGTFDQPAGSIPPDAFGGVVAFFPLLWVGMLVAYVVLIGAILRAVLAPDDRRAFYLRLSPAEGWMTLSALVAGVAAYVVFVLVTMALMMLVIAPLIFLLSYGQSAVAEESLVRLLPLLLLLLIYPFGLYLALRFAMAPVMSFDEGRFRLFGAWSLSRGQGWRLVGLWLCLTAMILAVEAVFMLILVAAGGAGFFFNVYDPMALQQLADRIWRFYGSPWMWLATAIGSLLAGPFMAIVVAPWARAYLMLREGTAPAATPAA